MNPSLEVIVERIRGGDPRALASFRVGRVATPDTVTELLRTPDRVWDDGVERCLTYSTPIGDISFLFAHYRYFFGRQRQMLTAVEVDNLNENQSDQ